MRWKNFRKKMGWGEYDVLVEIRGWKGSKIVAVHWWDRRIGGYFDGAGTAGIRHIVIIVELEF